MCKVTSYIGTVLSELEIVCVRKHMSGLEVVPLSLGGRSDQVVPVDDGCARKAEVLLYEVFQRLESGHDALTPGDWCRRRCGRERGNRGRVGRRRGRGHGGCGHRETCLRRTEQRLWCWRRGEGQVCVGHRGSLEDEGGRDDWRLRDRSLHFDVGGRAVLDNVLRVPLASLDWNGNSAVLTGRRGKITLPLRQEARCIESNARDSKMPRY